MIQQNTPEWLEMRKNMIGASDAPIIMGVSPWKTPFQLWEEKLGLRENVMNSAMKRGHDLEPIALKTYNGYMKTQATPMVLEHPTIPYMMASFDGVDAFGSPVEIKCVNAQDHEMARNGMIPPKYYPQVQHQLEVKQAQLLYYFSFRSENDFVVVEVEKDQAYVDELIIKERKFYECMNNFCAPDMTDKDYVERHDEEWLKEANAWRQVGSQIKFLETVQEQHRNKMISLSGKLPTMGGGVKMQNITRKGNVDYKSIPELKDVDLDKYRNPPISCIRFLECD